MMRKTLVLAFVFGLVGCTVSEQDRTEQEVNAAGEVLAPLPEEDERSWRQPEVIISVMPMLVGKTVGNLYAGDGFYAFELAKTGARVIATDPDPANVERMIARKKKEGLGDDVLLVRHAPEGTTGLEQNEADMALVVHSYRSIPDRIGFFQRLRLQLNAPRPLIMVDFNPEASPVGPPMDMRMLDREVMDEMDQVGYTDIGSYSKKLPYQWLMIAQDFVEMPEGLE
ncbi:MAG: class I SAM-dependent methyltransferase [Flavobacteriales bacterium]|nr:class I SAM-dependent methyltransferase [Flavobacteriales bacterium]